MAADRQTWPKERLLSPSEREECYQHPHQTSPLQRSACQPQRSLAGLPCRLSLAATGTVLQAPLPPQPAALSRSAWILLHMHAWGGRQAVDSCSQWCSLVQMRATSSYVFEGRRAVYCGQAAKGHSPGPAADFWGNGTALQTRPGSIVGP